MYWICVLCNYTWRRPKWTLVTIFYSIIIVTYYSVAIVFTQRKQKTSITRNGKTRSKTKHERRQPTTKPLISTFDVWSLLTSFAPWPSVFGLRAVSDLLRDKGDAAMLNMSGETVTYPWSLTTLTMILPSFSLLSFLMMFSSPPPSSLIVFWKEKQTELRNILS